MSTCFESNSTESSCAENGLSYGKTCVPFCYGLQNKCFQSECPCKKTEAGEIEMKTMDTALALPAPQGTKIIIFKHFFTLQIAQTTAAWTAATTTAECATCVPATTPPTPSRATLCATGCASSATGRAPAGGGGLLGEWRKRRRRKVCNKGRLGKRNRLHKVSVYFMCFAVLFLEKLPLYFCQFSGPENWSTTDNALAAPAGQGGDSETKQNSNNYSTIIPTFLSCIALFSLSSVEQLCNQRCKNHFWNQSPVCGSDGRTYSKPCLVWCWRVRVQCWKPCPCGRATADKIPMEGGNEAGGKNFTKKKLCSALRQFLFH